MIASFFCPSSPFCSFSLSDESSPLPQDKKKIVPNIKHTFKNKLLCVFFIFLVKKKYYKIFIINV
jgi:hypothetical protein